MIQLSLFCQPATIHMGDALMLVSVFNLVQIYMFRDVTTMQNIWFSTFLNLYHFGKGVFLVIFTFCESMLLLRNL